MDGWALSSIFFWLIGITKGMSIDLLHSYDFQIWTGTNWSQKGDILEIHVITGRNEFSYSLYSKRPRNVMLKKKPEKTFTFSVGKGLF